jgi:2-polyprenyl-3-methyl-5-hydroxy-6-metoxy-1,4-benzoquinol methylase
MSSERQLLNENDPWWGEHVHRYNEVLPYIGSGDTILDIACGTGFGSEILSRHTNGTVTGGDIAQDAVDECRRSWQRANLEFAVLDGTKLPYTDHYFDKIVSFETIEHTTQYLAMVQEFFRVLKPGGIAFISTPNFPVNSPSGKVTNPYHTQEFTYDQLSDLLRGVFPDVTITGQKYARYDDGKVNRAGKIVYWFFNIIGIRKFTPFSIKNKLSKLFSGKPFYPIPEDFVMTAQKEQLLACKTFFCICRK